MREAEGKGAMRAGGPASVRRQASAGPPAGTLRAWTLVLAAVTALAAGACGGDSGDRAGSAEAPPAGATADSGAPGARVPDSPAGTAGAPITPLPPAATGEDPRAAASAVLEALAAPDPELLAAWAHPEQGIHFSPYATVVPEEGVTFLPQTLRGLPEEDPVRSWGWYAGSGEPIEGTFADYHREFVWDQDFRTAPRVSVDERIGTSTTVDNLAEAFPGARVVEFHVPGSDPALEGMDWASLRLVMERADGRWWLRAVVHDQWTP